MKPFDSARTPLEPGFTLIEASAGTGKTTAITAIVLRLIVEEGLPIENILVTTYTELATAELRGRIRQILVEALAAAQNPSKDESLASQIISHTDRTTAVSRLHRALTCFDDAAIYTIHGFCARALADRAFESGMLFETELVAEQSDLLSEVARDFLRQNLYPASAIASAVAARGGVRVDELVRLLDEITNNPAIRILPNVENDWREIAKELETRWADFRDCWPALAEGLQEKFAHLDWAIHKHGKREVADAMLAVLASHCEETNGRGDIAECFEFFSAAKIRNSTRVKHASPKHAVFDRCEELHELSEQFALGLKVHFCSWAREELPRRKHEREVQSFSDLLVSLDEALHGTEGAALRDALRQSYRVALVDEFQDTDPVQYSIFAQIYRGTEAKVFLIGDPKQAIYGFRGADVFTYLRAKQDATRAYSLPRNWRSEKKLVAAVNEVFAARPGVFVFPGIEFSPVAAADLAEKEPLSRNGRRDSPLRIWLTNDAAKLAPAIAGEIARLLDGSAMIGSEPVKPADIAVLVHKNAQPAKIQQALARLGIPSVVYSAASVFHSEEAEELRRVLLAVAEPTRDGRIRAASVTNAVGLNANELAMLSDAQWEQRANAFAHYHQLWRDDGFVEMLRDFISSEGVRGRLLRLVDGERRLTNWLHLGELLHRACAENRFGMDGLITWLERQMTENFATREEYELRLESDDDAVRLVTVHKSKGLQYPITFCPFAWEKPPGSRGPAKFHQDDALVLDLEKTSEHDEQRRTERLAEMVRQFYVALTRARHRGYAVWVESDDAKKSAPAWIFSGMDAAHFVRNGIDATAVARKLRARFSDSDAIALEDLPETTTLRLRREMSTPSNFTVRELKRAIDRSWGISSFTSFLSGRREENEEEDLDAIEAEEELEEPAVAREGIHAFPRGVRGGTCLHRILEEIDFSDETDVRARTGELLQKFNIRESDEIVCDTILSMLRTPLTEAGTSLDQLTGQRRVPEMHFTLPLQNLTLEKLGALFAHAAIPLQIDRLQFLPTRGFLKGSIDLVFENADRFFIVDWKSNWLGPASASYTRENMAVEMQRNFYLLQLNLYTVALHRHLGQRLPGYDYETNFGGAFYIFLRGIENTSRGIFYERPAHSFIRSLDRLFCGNA